MDVSSSSSHSFRQRRP
uniref:Uncharacterized protein n=1 Tax=Anguilla anguilla TaxID=7936 RepID=A0A0E9TZ92_ANGAN